MNPTGPSCDDSGSASQNTENRISVISSVSSKTNNDTAFILRETNTVAHIPRRNTRFNPYKNSYVQTNVAKQKKYFQMRLAHGQQILDDTWVGDNFDTTAKKKSIRFWMQNVNGLVYKGQVQDFQLDMATVADKGVNYFSMSETCVNTNKYGYAQEINEAFCQVLPNGHINIHNTPKYPTSNNYQPGGVAAGFDCTLRSNFIREGRDKYGRWVWQEFGDNNTITRIYTIYRVINGSMENSGHCTAWSQQRLLLEQDKVTPSNPRKHVLDSLITEIKPIINKGHNLILLGDFNESILSPENMNEKFSNIGLYNLMSHKLGSTNLPRTFIRGRDAIDHVWMTRYLVDNTTFAGYAPFDVNYISDHRGLYFDIPRNVLFPTSVSRIAPHKFRKLKSSIPKRVRAYLKKLNDE